MDKINTKPATGAAVMQLRVTHALTRALFVEWARHGYAALSLEAVARRAGVGKAALYRRWPSKLAMIVDRLEKVGLDLAIAPDSGSLAGDLHAMLIALRHQLRHSLVRRILADLHAEMTRNSLLSQKIRQRLQVERRERGTAVLQRAIARGEIAANTDVDIVNDAIGAMLYWRLVITDGSAGDAYLEALTQAILQIARCSLK